MRATIILCSIGHKCFLKKRSSPVVRGIEFSIIAHSRLLQRKGREPQMGKKSYVRLRSRRLPISGLDKNLFEGRLTMYAVVSSF